VPYDVAFGLDEAERLAFIVVFGQIDGLKFDWKRLRWEDVLK
jgi:hypothetical protein